MSAYDMEVSDAVYGKADRYVSLGRLEAMLEREFDLDVERLDDSRGDSTCFFAFADTVVARSYRGGNECHGWMGVRFQAQSRDEPSQIVRARADARRRRRRSSRRRSASSASTCCTPPSSSARSPSRSSRACSTGCSTGRIEIDLISFNGIEFRRVDNRLMALELVQLGLSRRGDVRAGRPGAAAQRGAAQEGGPGRARQLPAADRREHRHAAVRAARSSRPTRRWPARQSSPLTELTMRNLLAEGDEVDRRDFLARADLLAACGMTVLISDYFEYSRLAAYLAGRTGERIGIVMGVPSLLDLFDESNHAHLQGGILESFGRLFKNDLRLFVYPMLRRRHGRRRPSRRWRSTPELQPLYDYLAGAAASSTSTTTGPSYLPIISRDVLRRIADGDPTGSRWCRRRSPSSSQAVLLRPPQGLSRGRRDRPPACA